MELTPIVELGVADAYELLAERLGVTGLPPLDAIENEDWARDYLLDRFMTISSLALAEVGLTLDDSPALDDSWLEEIERRSAEYEAGGVEPIPWSEVKKQIWKDSQGNE